MCMCFQLNYLCSNMLVILSVLPVQRDPLSLPSPVKPVGHVQVKLPSVSKHVAPVTQSCNGLAVLHSSISTSSYY